jgi:RNA polymerase sigma-70 factor (ECF subfamily)
MPSSAERELLDQIRSGDRAALGLLLKSQERRLYNVCLRMVGNRDDAAEVCQDAMLKIVQHVDSFRGDAALSTWMVRIAMNQSISHLRKRRLRITTPLDAADNGQDADPGGTALRHRLADTREPAPDVGVEQSEMLQLLQIAIDRISAEFRAVLVLRDIDELDYRQISEVLDLPVGTVKSRLFRARLALREQMVALGATDGATAAPEVGGRDG